MKLIKLGFLFTIGILFLTSCQSTPKINPDSYEMILSSTSPRSEEENALYSTYYQSDSAAATKTVTFNGKDYTGEYDQSLYSNSHQYPIDQYSLKEEKGYFQTRADTGDLVHIWFYNPDADEDDIKPLSEAALDDLARSYASQFDSLDGRRMTRDTFSSGSVYEYTFVRYVNDCKTEDKIYVRLMADGALYGVNAGCIGMFSGNAAKTETDLLNPETCRELIKQHFEKTVKEIGEMTYHITMSGKVFLRTTVSFDDGNSQYDRPVFIWVEWKSEDSAPGSS